MEDSRVLALGFFDGVHIGHGALLRKTRQEADRLGISACALTFDAHPMSLVGNQSVPLLSTADDRRMLMQSLYGIDELIIAHFDKPLMSMPWQRFLDDYLIGELYACHLVCGHDFRFGFRGEGTAELLQNACRERGIGCDVIGKVCLHEQVVSSTLIRQYLLQGDLQTACGLLGHSYLISGFAESGVLNTQPGILLPPDGTYEAEIYRKSAVVSIRNGRIILPEPISAPAFSVFFINRIDTETPV